MRPDCGHPEAAYEILTCGDADIADTGCGAAFRACWECAQSGAAVDRSETWWQWHKVRCSVGYHDRYETCPRCGEPYEEGSGWESCPHGADE